MKRSWKFVCRGLFIALIFFINFIVTSSASAALYTIEGNERWFQSPTTGTLLGSDGDCEIGGDAVLISINSPTDLSRQYSQFLARIIVPPGVYLPLLGAGYMDGPNISPTGVSRVAESTDGPGEFSRAVFDFPSVLNPGDVPN